MFESPENDQQLLVLRVIVVLGSIAVVILDCEYLRLMSSDCSRNRDNMDKPLQYCFDKVLGDIVSRNPHGSVFWDSGIGICSPACDIQDL